MPVQLEKLVQLEKHLSGNFADGPTKTNSLASQWKPSSLNPASDLRKSSHGYISSAQPPFDFFENRSEMEPVPSRLNSMHQLVTEPTSNQEDSKEGKQTSNFDWEKFAGEEDDTYTGSGTKGTPWGKSLESRIAEIDRSLKKSAQNSLTS